MKRVFWFGPYVFTKCRGGIQPGRDRIVQDSVAATFSSSALEHMVIANPNTSEVEHVGSAVDLDTFIHKYPHFKRPLAKATGISVVATLGNIVKIEVREELTEEQKQQQAVLDVILADEAPVPQVAANTETPPTEVVEASDSKKPRGRPKKTE